MSKASSSHLTITGAKSYPRKIDAIKTVRRAADWGLKEAKETIDAVLGGEQRTIPLSGKTSGEKTAQRLAELGFESELDGNPFYPSEEWVYRPTWAEEQRGSFEVQTLRDLTTSGFLCIEGTLASGELATGDRIGLPLSGSVVVVLPIARVKAKGDGMIIYSTANAEDFVFWNAMSPVGEVVPILSPAIS